MLTVQRFRNPIRDQHDLIHAAYKRGSSYAGVGDKKVYDPRVYMTLAETAMAELVRQAITELGDLGPR